MANHDFPTFDAAAGARPLFKERVLWTAVLGLFFFLVYGSANEIAALTAPHPSFFWAWERNIPFVPEFVVPYMSSDLVFVVAFLLAPTRADIQKLGIRLGLAIVVSALFFVALPLQFGFDRPPVAGWPAGWFDLLGLDKPYNQFPSLHISLGFLAWLEIRLRLKGPAGWLVSLWFLAIAASTLLVYQHHAIDLVGAVGVTVLLFRLVPPQGQGWPRLGFVTPRHMHMALRYLVLAALATVGAFHAGTGGAILLGWIALSLLGVAASYTLGLNGFLRKGRQGYPLVSQLLFWPYLVGSWVNWRYWRSRVPLMAPVRPGLWIGARPGPEDWPRLEEAGIRTVIDLAPELAASVPAAMAHHHAPLLDIAIPAPAALEEIARGIAEHRAEGGVYVHCALGMSRSVLAVCACLIREGMTQEEALALMDRVRPERVRRPYIAIALDLFERRLGGEAAP